MTITVLICVIKQVKGKEDGNRKNRNNKEAIGDYNICRNFYGNDKFFFRHKFHQEDKK